MDVPKAMPFISMEWQLYLRDQVFYDKKNFLFLLHKITTNDNVCWSARNIFWLGLNVVFVTAEKHYPPLEFAHI